MRSSLYRNLGPLYSAILLGLMVASNLIPNGIRYYHELALTFLSGRLHIDSAATAATDMALYKGLFYYPDGPLPAVLMMPFVGVGWMIEQGLVALPINLGIFYLCFQLAKLHEFSISDACWFAIGFCFATSFVGAALNSLGIAHSVVVLCLFLAIHEYQTRGRLPLIGFYVGLAMSSRMPAGLNILLFIGLITVKSSTLGEIATGLIKLSAGFAPLVALLGLYNFARFGNPLESGYSYQIVRAGIPYSEWNSPGNTAGPIFSLANIPDHLMTFLFGLPNPLLVGTSVILVSPFLIYLVYVRWDLTNKLIAADVLIVLAVVLAFRSTGREQLGYRFSLDFLPFVFWLFMRSSKQLTPAFKTIVFLSSVVDLYLVKYTLENAFRNRQLGI